MKGMLFRLSIALLALAAGIIVTRVFRSLALFNGPSTPASHSVFLVSTHATANGQSNKVQVAQNKVDPLEAAYVEGDKLSYENYDVERSTDTRGLESTATIKKNGRIIASLRNGGFGKESTRFGLFSLLGGESKQLVIMQYTGGAH